LSPEATAKAQQYSVTQYSHARNNLEVEVDFWHWEWWVYVTAAKEFYQYVHQMAFTLLH